MFSRGYGLDKNRASWLARNVLAIVGMIITPSESRGYGLPQNMRGINGLGHLMKSRGYGQCPIMFYYVNSARQYNQGVRWANLIILGAEPISPNALFRDCWHRYC